ncbi:unnamed protein product [Brugia timori]|uniref:Uncharacterized protein n=1 Tax=Brugia timori TaxID=42155 RepID=A0A3P7TA44_9BILA|nr:unnamed protein product [Brugia timori]
MFFPLAIVIQSGQQPNSVLEQCLVVVVALPEVPFRNKSSSSSSNIVIVIFVLSVIVSLPHAISALSPVSSFITSQSFSSLELIDCSLSSPLPSIAAMNSAQPSPAIPCASVTLSLQQPNGEPEQFEQPARYGPVAIVTLSGQHPNSLSSHAENYYNQNINYKIYFCLPK